jgi:hypothetical protein
MDVSVEYIINGIALVDVDVFPVYCIPEKFYDELKGIGFLESIERRTGISKRTGTDSISTQFDYVTLYSIDDPTTSRKLIDLHYKFHTSNYYNSHFNLKKSLGEYTDFDIEIIKSSYILNEFDIEIIRRFNDGG